jgi:hypothetical protein
MTIKLVSFLKYISSVKEGMAGLFVLIIEGMKSDNGLKCTKAVRY